MTEQETINIVTLIVMSYPSSDKFKDDTSLKGMVAVWKTIFKDDDVRLVEMAVQKHISVNKWPPSIAEVREQMVNLTRPDIVPPDIAWSMVSDVLYAKGEYSSFDLYATFPEAIARVIETIGWSNLYSLHCNRYGKNADGMDRVAFMDLYKPVYAREREQAMLPERIRQVCDKKQKEVAGETLQMIEAAQYERREREDYYAGIFEKNHKKLIEHRETKLLGGNENE